MRSAQSFYLAFLCFACSYIAVQLWFHGDVLQRPTAKELLLALICAPFAFLVATTIAWITREDKPPQER